MVGIQEAQCFVHYSNWNKNWDEWVFESRLLKYNDINLQQQKELAQAGKNSNKGLLKHRGEKGVKERLKRKGRGDDGADTVGIFCFVFLLVVDMF